MREAAIAGISGGAAALAGVVAAALAPPGDVAIVVSFIAAVLVAIAVSAYLNAPWDKIDAQRDSVEAAPAYALSQGSRPRGGSQKCVAQMPLSRHKAQHPQTNFAQAPRRRLSIRYYACPMASALSGEIVRLDRRIKRSEG